MKTTDLLACNLVELDVAEQLTINGGGMAGPPAGYWTSHIDDATCQEVGEEALKAAWDWFWKLVGFLV